MDKVQNNILAKIIQLAKANTDIAVLWLYGSRSQGTSHAHSDYDLAIAFEIFIQDPWQRRIRPEELRIDWSQVLECPIELISIIDINTVPIPLAWEVISKGKPIWVKDSDRLMQEENRISSCYDLDVCYHRNRYGR